MITFKKRILNLRVYNNLNNKEKVVYGVEWHFCAEEDGVEVFVPLYTSIPALDGDFISYENLTEETVNQWINTFSPDNYIESSKLRLENDLANKKIKSVLQPYWVVEAQEQAVQNTTVVISDSTSV
jgi:hypothetical protein